MRAALLTLCAALAAGALAAPAAAAPYTVWSCRDAAGAPLPTRAWLPAGTPARVRTRARPAAGSTSRSAPATPRSGTVSGYRFDVPPGVTITGYTAWLAAATSTGRSRRVLLGRTRPGRRARGAHHARRVLHDAAACSSGTFSDPLADANEARCPWCSAASRSSRPARTAALAGCQRGRRSARAHDALPQRGRARRCRCTVGRRRGGTLSTTEPVSGTRTIVVDARRQRQWRCSASSCWSTAPSSTCRSSPGPARLPTASPTRARATCARRSRSTRRR